jgi:hypothetical protein
MHACLRGTGVTQVWAFCQVIPAIFWDNGIRFVYTTRSKLPQILNSDGKV